MPSLKIVVDSTKPGPDGKPFIDNADGSIVPGAITAIGGVPGGMKSGKTSVAVVVKLDDGRQAFAETSLDLFYGAARALKAGDEPPLDPMKESQKTLGQAAFEAYTRERDGKNHGGSETPPWEKLGDGVQQGWEAAAGAVVARVGLNMFKPGKL